MNDSIIKGKWTEIKGEIQTAWGDLTSDDLDSTQGNLSSIAGLIQQKYGHAKDEVTSKLQALAAKFTDSAEQPANEAASVTADVTQEAKDALRDTPRH